MSVRVRPAAVGWVFLGGSAGSSVRYLLGSWFAGSAGGFPWTTFAINVSGALLLGCLLEALALRGSDTGRRRAARLGFGTGMLGGYTTYSTFIVESLRLGSDGQLLLAASYLVGSILTGFAAAWVGVAATRYFGTRGAVG